MTRMMKKNFNEVAKVMTEAAFNGVEITKLDFIKEAEDVTVIEAESIMSQRLLRGFGFVTC